MHPIEPAINAKL